MAPMAIASSPVGRPVLSSGAPPEFGRTLGEAVGTAEGCGVGDAAATAVKDPKSPCSSPPVPAVKNNVVASPAAPPLPKANAQRPGMPTALPSSAVNAPTKAPVPGLNA